MAFVKLSIKSAPAVRECRSTSMSRYSLFRFHRLRFYSRDNYDSQLKADFTQPPPGHTSNHIQEVVGIECRHQKTLTRVGKICRRALNFTSPLN